MSGGAAGAGAGAAAADAAAARARREEEEMTDYHQHDLAEDWEFKILRSSTGAFKNPERLKEILAEETRAGWVLLEKFDNQRIRLKRPGTAREGDAMLDFDPYRTVVGLSEAKLGIMIVAAVLGLLLIIAAIATLK